MGPVVLGRYGPVHPAKPARHPLELQVFLSPRDNRRPKRSAPRPIPGEVARLRTHGGHSIITPPRDCRDRSGTARAGAADRTYQTRTGLGLCA